MSGFPEVWPPLERRVFEGRWCRLEPLDPARHGDALFEAASGPEAERLHRFLAEAPPPSREAFEGWLTGAAATGDPMFFAVIDRATGRAEGRQALMDLDRANGAAEIGNILWGPRIAGTRVATEAFFLHAEHAFALGYRRWVWKCDAENAPSRRAAARFGFRAEGLFRRHRVVKGRNRDTAWFSILDSEWPAIAEGFRRWLDPANFDAEGRQIAGLEALRG